VPIWTTRRVALRPPEGRPEASIEPPGLDLDSAWYELDAIDVSEFGQGKYWITLSIMQPKLANVAAVIEKELGRPAQGKTSGGDVAWAMPTGALIARPTVPSVTFASGPVNDSVEIASAPHLPSYAEALIRLHHAGWVPSSEER